MIRHLRALALISTTLAATGCQRDDGGPVSPTTDDLVVPGAPAPMQVPAVAPFLPEEQALSMVLAPQEASRSRSLALAGTTFVVDDDGADCPGAGFSTIQAAVNAAALSPGTDEIEVCAGTYPEDVLIGPGPNPVEIEGDGAGATVVTGVAGSSNPIIHADQADNVEIEKLSVDGLSARSGGAAYGVRYDNTDGHVENTEIRNIRNASGSTQGIGIGVIASSGTADVGIEKNLLENITRAHILVNGIGANADISKNDLIGPILPKVWAPNGIQSSRGGTAEIEKNDLSGFTSPNPPGGAGSGIILFCAGPTTVEKNEITASDLGVAVGDTQDGQVLKNEITDSVFEGVSLQFIGTFFGPLGCPIFPSPTTNNTIEKNEIESSGDNGISLAGFDANNPLAPSDNHIEKNNVSSSGDVGIAVFAVFGSNPSGNVFDKNDVSGSGVFSCDDDSQGTGTSGTGNTWTDNSGEAPDDPDGICPGDGDGDDDEDDEDEDEEEDDDDDDEDD